MILFFGLLFLSALFACGEGYPRPEKINPPGTIVNRNKCGHTPIYKAVPMMTPIAETPEGYVYKIEDGYINIYVYEDPCSSTAGIAIVHR